MRIKETSVISQTAKHALAALAEPPEGQYAGAREIAGDIDAPPNDLGKLLQTLASDGLVRAC